MEFGLELGFPRHLLKFGVPSAPFVLVLGHQNVGMQTNTGIDGFHAHQGDAGELGT